MWRVPRDETEQSENKKEIQTDPVFHAGQVSRRDENPLLRVLAGSGAETNLIRRHLLPQKMLRASPNLLALVTASGDRMAGGQREVTLELSLGAGYLEKRG